jgi:hydrogenase expression/formation protein HypC
MIGEEVPQMCLAVPGRVDTISDEGGLKFARVDFGGVFRKACLEYLPETAVGDYVLVHVGFAISRLSEEEAQETLRALAELGLETLPDETVP